eukprot:scaffold66_cov115-Cylindrotheca_fusiformis.AAC.15
MKIQLTTISLSLIAFRYSEAFAPSTGRSLATPSLLSKNARHAKTFRFATASGSVDDRKNPEEEAERLRAMARQLREEASALAAEQANKVSEATKRAFAKFDLNKDGAISADELKAGLEKAFKNEIPYNRIKKLVDKFDQNGDGKLQMNEFVSVDKLRNQLDSLIREEKAIELSESKRVQQAKESEKLKEMLVSIINDDEPTASDKALSVAPYLLPLLDSLQFAAFFAVNHPDNVFAQAAAVAYGIYRSIPFGGFLAFFALSYFSTNPSLNKLVRFNMQQAIFLDIALFFPGILSFLYSAAASNLPLNLPTEAIEYGSDAVVLAMLASIAYATASSLMGKTPDKLPVVSQAAKDRTITRDMFDDVGRFMGRKPNDDKDDN